MCGKGPVSSTFSKATVKMRIRCEAMDRKEGGQRGASSPTQKEKHFTKTTTQKNYRLCLETQPFAKQSLLAVMWKQVKVQDIPVVTSQTRHCGREGHQQES